MNRAPLRIRPAHEGDAAAIAAIYGPYVTATTVSFEESAPDAEEMARRISATTQSYPWLVATLGDEVIGYAYASQHRSRAAYRTSVDVACYVAQSVQRQGVGRTLYAELLDQAAKAGFHAAFAGIAIPNEASLALHRSAGFTPVGVYREVGFKLGRWIDVAWFQRLL